MATAAPAHNPERLLSEIDEQLLLCPICYSRFKSPKILPCFHTFCEHCLDEWVGTNNGKLVCPTCKEDTPLTSRGVEGIRENRFIADLLNLVSDIIDISNDAQCENCTNVATIWCNDCAQFFCDDCKPIHTTVRALRNHQLLAIEEYNKKAEAQHGSVIKPRFCEIHENDKLEFFCDTCQITVCLRCTVVEHSSKTHEIISMDIAMEKNLPTMKEHVTSLAQKTVDLKKEKKRMEIVVEQLKQNKTKTEQQIKDTATKLQAMIKKEESELLRAVSDMYDPKRKQADAVIESLEFSLVTTESVHFYLSNLLTHGGAIDVMSEKKELNLRVHSIQGRLMCETIKDSAFHFQPNMEDIILGTLYDSDTTLATSEVSGNTTMKTREFGLSSASSVKRCDTKQSKPTVFDEASYDTLGDTNLSRSSGANEARVGADVMEYVYHVHLDKLKADGKKYNVEFVWNGGESLSIIPAKGKTGNVNKAYDSIVSFVQGIHTKLVSKVIDISKEKSISTHEVAKAKKRTQKDYPEVLIKETADNHTIRVYGEDQDVKLAIESFYQFIGVPSRHGGKKRHAKVDQYERFGHKTHTDKIYSGTVLSFQASNGTKVSICHGDITKQNVDVIVNAANNTLNHGGGVAGAIVNAGGIGIQNESNDIMTGRRYKPLKVGDVVYTNAGRLPCQYVIHVVGPQWKDRNTYSVEHMLYTCCHKTLTMASSDLKAKSVAVTAIGTGIYKVPKDVCAVNMYNAVTQFIKNQGATDCLRDIRFIDVDQHTVTAFTDVFEKSLLMFNIRYHKRPSASPGSGHVVKLPGKETDLDTASQSTHSISYADVTRSSGGSSPHGAIPRSSVNKVEYSEAKSDEDNNCPICIDTFTNPKTLPCKHRFCKECIDQAEKTRGPSCPVCKKPFGLITGNMPKGTMNNYVMRSSLPGYQGCDTIIIDYYFPPGRQKANDPSPGSSYSGTSRTAYLPDNREGREVLRLLKLAFERKLTFIIGTSVTTRCNNTVVWNDIHHKTSKYGGPSGFGYPDDTYLKQVKEELAAKGVV